jgi:hypothetical protein
MPWLRHFALFLVFVTALFRPAAAGAFVSAPDANAQARIGAFELVAATLVGPANAATCGLHEGIGAAYDENASAYRFGDRAALEAGQGLTPRRVGGTIAEHVAGADTGYISASRQWLELRDTGLAMASWQSTWTGRLRVAQGMWIMPMSLRR